MSERRFTTWHVLGLVALVLGLSAASLAGGVFLGYQWGRASGISAASRAAREAGEVPRAFRLPGLEPGGPKEVPFQRPFLGVTFETITPELAEAEGLPVQSGALIREVIAGSPADSAGIEVGDIVQAVNGEPVDADHSLRDRIADREPGEAVRLTILRDGDTLEVEATLEARPALRPFRSDDPRDWLEPALPQFYHCWPGPCPSQPEPGEQGLPG